MKSRSIKILVFLLIGLLLLHGLAYVAQANNPDGTTTFLMKDEAHVRQALENRDKIEAIVLGNSHGDAIDFSFMHHNGVQLSRAWGDFFEDEYYLKYFVPKLNSLNTVFIAVSYFTSSWDNAATEKLDLRRSQIYTVIPAWSFIQGDFGNFVRGRGNKIFPIQNILREDNWRGVVYTLLRSEEMNEELPQSPAIDCKLIGKAELSRLAVSRVDEQVAFVSEIARNRPTIQEDNLNVVIRIIQYLQVRDIRLVFFTPPYYSAYNQQYSRANPEGIKTMKDQMLKLQREYGIEYYDFSTDPKYINDETLFKDSDHLNLCGKKIFSENFENYLYNALSVP